MNLVGEKSVFWHAKKTSKLIKKNQKKQPKMDLLIGGKYSCHIVSMQVWFLYKDLTLYYAQLMATLQKSYPFFQYVIEYCVFVCFLILFFLSSGFAYCSQFCMCGCWYAYIGVRCVCVLVCGRHGVCACMCVREENVNLISNKTIISLIVCLGFYYFSTFIDVHNTIKISMLNLLNFFTCILGKMYKSVPHLYFI